MFNSQDTQVKELTGSSLTFICPWWHTLTTHKHTRYTSLAVIWTRQGKDAKWSSSAFETLDKAAWSPKGWLSKENTNGHIYLISQGFPRELGRWLEELSQIVKCNFSETGLNKCGTDSRQQRRVWSLHSRMINGLGVQTQAQWPGIGFSTLAKTRQRLTHPWSRLGGGRDKITFSPCWPASLVKLVSFRFSERVCLKKWGKKRVRERPGTGSSLHVNKHMYVHSQSTYTNTQKMFIR